MSWPNMSYWVKFKTSTSRKKLLLNSWESRPNPSKQSVDQEPDFYQNRAIKILYSNWLVLGHSLKSWFPWRSLQRGLEERFNLVPKKTMTWKTWRAGEEDYPVRWLCSDEWVSCLEWVNWWDDSQVWSRSPAHTTVPSRKEKKSQQPKNWDSFIQVCPAFSSFNLPTNFDPDKKRHSHSMNVATTVFYHAN